MITVVCVWVQGHVGYTADYVVKLRNMVARNLHHPHRFLCLTDQPHNSMLAGIDTVQIETPQGYFAWWAKIQLFNPRLFSAADMVLYFDLDVLVVRPLGWVFEYQNFTLIPHAGTFKGSGSHRVIPKYNSSVMVWRAEQGYHLFNAWSRDVTTRLWGDQDWIAERMPNANTFPLEWFPRLSEIRAGIIPERARVVLTKKPKNHVAARQWPWFAKLWA